MYGLLMNTDVGTTILGINLGFWALGLGFVFDLFSGMSLLI